MTKDILIQLLNVHLWDIIDKFMIENNDYFAMVNNIYNICIVDCKIQRPGILSLIVNGSILIFFLGAKHELTLIFNDSDYAYIEYRKRPQKVNFDTYMEGAVRLSDLFERYLPSFHLLQAIYVMKNTLYKGKVFEDLFISKISDYIMEEYVKGNLSQEFIDFLTSLLA